MASSPKICEKGHEFYKSSDCPTCPICENERKPVKGFLSSVSAPARRALEGKGITTLLALSKYSEKELLGLHGFGASTIPILRSALEAEGLAFKSL